MKGLALFDILCTFLSEATLLIGWPRLILAVGILMLLGAGVLWGFSQLLCRGEKQVGAIISTILLLLLIVGVLSAVHLVTVLGKLAAPEQEGLSTFVLQLGTMVAVLLLFTAVQGAFKTVWWKAALLTLLLLGTTGAVGVAAIPQFFAPEKEQLTVLAGQCAGVSTGEQWLVKSEAANKQIKMRQVRREREELLAQQNAMFQVYTDLQLARQQLNPKDQVGIQAFNKRAADYSQKTQELRTNLARVDALIAADSSK